MGGGLLQWPRRCDAPGRAALCDVACTPEFTGVCAADCSVLRAALHLRNQQEQGRCEAQLHLWVSGVSGVRSLQLPSGLALRFCALLSSTLPQVL